MQVTSSTDIDPAAEFGADKQALWRGLKRRFEALAEAGRSDADADLVAAWDAFTAVAAYTAEVPLPHHGLLLECLDRVAADRDPAAIKILDHGCGAGLNALYLAARGYPRVYGVNVNAPVDHLNRIARVALGAEDQRFHQTDGGALPFPDEFFDFIFSNQVLEHVSDAHIETYYTEEGRVLAPGGGAFHEVPHLLVPYDSHSRVWFAHMLPRFLKPIGYGVGKSIERRKWHLHLGAAYTRHIEALCTFRTPFYHRRMARRHIGSLEDLTLKRLVRPMDESTYDPDGSLLGRRLAGWLVRAPFIGALVAPLVSNMVMLHTIVLKTSRR